MTKTLPLSLIGLIVTCLTLVGWAGPIDESLIQRDWHNWSVFVQARRDLPTRTQPVHASELSTPAEGPVGLAGQDMARGGGKQGAKLWHGSGPDDERDPLASSPSGAGKLGNRARELGGPKSQTVHRRSAANGPMLRFSHHQRDAYLRDDERRQLISIIRFVGLGSSPDSEDAIQKNGHIFEGWPRPELVLVFTGELDGYLEPCGCAGLENQKGGLMRRHTLLTEFAREGWPTLAVDLGGQVRRLGRQAKLKFDYAIECLATSGYAAVGFGPMDLKMDPLSTALNLEGNNPFVCANVAIISFDSGFSQRYKVVNVGGKRIGITAVLGVAKQAALQNLEDIVLTDPVDALHEVVPQMKAEQCDVLVLLSHADPRESRQLARQFPEFNFVATAGGGGEPPFRLEKIEGSDGYLVEVGHKGMHVAAIGIYADGEPTLRYQRVPLDHRFRDSPQMHAALARYQKDLRDMGLPWLAQQAPHPSGDRTFVGSAVCGDCHTEAMAVFEGSPHAHATETLTALDPERQFDPECLSCHATGWNPQKFYPYRSGFAGIAETPHLVANGCENCHGPGSAHVAAENDGASDAEIEARREEMRLKVVANEGNSKGQTSGQVVRQCMECHDLDNSPDFDFQEYWAEERGVRHSGVD